MEGGSSDPRVPLGQWPSRASTEGLCREKEARKGRCWCAVLPRNVLPRNVLPSAVLPRNVPPRPRLLVLCSQPRSPQPCRWVAGTQTGRTRSPRDPDCHRRSRAWPAHGAVRSRGVRVCAESSQCSKRGPHSGSFCSAGASPPLRARRVPGQNEIIPARPALSASSGHPSGPPFPTSNVLVIHQRR